MYKNTQEIHALLDRISGDHSLPDDCRRYLVAALVQHKLTRHGLLLKDGDISTRLYFIQQGIIRGYATRGAVRITTWFFQENEVALSASSLFTEKPSTEALQAVEPCVLYSLSKADTMHIGATYPAFSTLMQSHFNSLDKRYKAAMSAITAMDQKKHMPWFKENFPGLKARVPDAYVASFLHAYYE